MEDYFDNKTKIHLWKKILCVFLSIIIALGTFITLTFGNSKFQKWLGIHSMLSAYAAEIVDTKGAIAVNEEAMLAENHTINLENRDGSNTVYLFSEPISFTDEDGNIKAKDISVESADSELKSVGFDYTNGQNDYRINFSKDQSIGIQAAFDNCSYSIIPMSTFTAEGTKSTAEFLNESFEVFQYENIYGIGTNLRFYPQLNGIKDEIVLNQNINKNVFSFELKTENCTAQLNEDGTISLVNMDGATIQTFTAPFAYDSEYIEGDINSHRVDCQYDLKDKNETSYIMTITVPGEWLTSENTKYPVIIDPTTGQLGNYRDAGIYKSVPNNCYGKEQTCCFGRSSEYGYGRVLNQFTMPTDIKKGAKINSAYTWQRETTGRTTNTQVTPHMITSAWYEGNVTWTSRPRYNSVVGTTRNIASASTDDPNNPYWYRFNISNIVNKWVNEDKPNYGYCFESSEEQNYNYNWRAFASRDYSTSAMRPYAVISYTNETTKPTISITKNPNGWTNQKVTFTISASDSGSGLASSAYSFSNASGSYSWSTAKTKTYSTNQTVYFAAKDNVGNIATTSRVTYIDKLKPSTPTATLSKTDWSQSNISITVKSDDAAATSSNGKSGVKYYCCTQTTTPTDWKSVSTLNSSYTFTNIGNGTYNLYAKDQAGNISSPKTINISCVDPEAPVVNEAKVYTEDATKESCIHILASDETSGINAYSINGGQDWIAVEPTKLLDVNIDPKLYDENEQIDVRVKDQSGRISNGKIIPLKTPKFYEYNGLVGIYNPNNNKTTVQYKIGENGEWTIYKNPFDVPLGNTSTIYTRLEESDAEYKKTVTPDFSSVNTYSESNTDFSLNYKNLSFDFIRTYNSSKNSWFYSTDSKVEVVNDYVIKAIMPDSTELVFVKTENNKYIDEINGYTLTVENGYVIEIDDISYIYDTNRMIKEIRGNYNNVITVNRTSSSIIIKDKANRTYTINLDSNGNITTVTDPANNTITYTFDSNNKLTQVVDQAGVIIGRYVYTNGVLTKSMDKNINYRTDGRVASYVYDSGAYTNYSYDDENMTVSTENSVGETTSQTYNDALMIVSTTDEDGNTTEYTYDEHYRTVSETSDGATVTYTYDDKGNLLSEVSDDENAENTYYTYDLNGNVIRQQTGTAYTYYVYNENDELTLSATLKEDYDGEVPNSYNSDLTCFDTVSYTYNTDGTLQQTVDSKENETVTYLYDSYGNAVKTTSSKVKDNETTVGVNDCTYDIMGNMLTSVSGEDTSSYIYDKAGRTLLANEKGDCTRTIYDNLGRVVRKIGPQDYDSTKDGLPSENTYSDSNVGQRYVYNETTGNLTSETNRLGVTTTYTYYDTGEKETESFDIYEYDYNINGDIENIWVSKSNSESPYAHYNYDENNNNISIVYANGQSVEYHYNDNGNVTEQLFKAISTDTATLQFKYIYDTTDMDKLLYKIDYINNVTEWYEDNDRVAIYQLAYNSNNEIVKGDFISSYQNTTDENDDAITYHTNSNNSSSIVYTYSENSDSFVTDYGTYNYTYSENDDGSTSSILKNSDNNAIISYNYTYNDDGSVSGYTVTTPSYSKAFKYEYDSSGRIKSYGSVLSGNNYNPNDYQHYYYGERDELIRADISNGQVINGTVKYIYDNRDNMHKAESYDYTSSEEITGSPVDTLEFSFSYEDKVWIDSIEATDTAEETFIYDDNGNPISMEDLNFHWTNGRNLSSITYTDDNNEVATLISFKYDDNGIRVSKTYGDTTTYYTTINGTITSQYELDENDNPINVIEFIYDSNDEIIGFTYNNNTYFYIKNIQGDITNIVDNTGNVLVNYYYDAWGVPYGENLSNDNLAEINPMRYRGYYYDCEMGLYYLQSRYYIPTFCRFLNSDLPIYAQMQKDDYTGLNLFAYCCNEPVNNIDPSGYWVETVIDVVSVGWSISEFCKSPSWLNLGFLVWDIGAACIPFAPGSYTLKGAKATIKVADSISDLKKTKALTTGTYKGLRSIFKKSKILSKSSKIEIHHIIEKRFKDLFKVKPDNFFSIPLSKELHKEITRRWRNKIGYKINYKKHITYKKMEEAIKEVYHDMPELRDYALKWFKQNWIGKR